MEERIARHKHPRLLGRFVSYEKIKCCEYIPRDCIHNSSFSLKLINGINRLDDYNTLHKNGFAGTNTLAYWADS
jgi:hypothetical protein